MHAFPRTRMVIAVALASALANRGAWASDSTAPNQGAIAETDARASWQAFAKAREGNCVAKPGTLESPLPLEAAGRRYRLEGFRLVEDTTDTDDTLRIGVISAIKDERDETLDAISSLVRQLRTLEVDVILANGDLGTHDLDLADRIFPALASSGVLVIAHVGNTESCGAFNRSAMRVFENAPNFINGNWVREIALDDGTLFVMPGYHDRRFNHTAGAAKYDERDVEALAQVIAANTRSVPNILVSHGPPKMTGAAAIDIAHGAGHVGDPLLAGLIARRNISFGVFGHILEAGGRATDRLGDDKRRADRWYDSLYVNAGTANPDPWRMLDGRPSNGMGMFVEVRGGRARYRVMRPNISRS